jgi:glycosyltransferase involved in cell wall biosynthesis
LLLANGWQLADGPALSLSPWRYRDYILSSKAEFTVAREFNVLPRSGWFSERSACYLAAGRPVIAQDTGFSDLLPTGEGLFAFSTVEEAVDAISAINADYARHAKAARAIAHDWFRAEVVLPKLLADLSV